MVNTFEYWLWGGYSFLFNSPKGTCHLFQITPVGEEGVTVVRVIGATTDCAAVNRSTKLGVLEASLTLSRSKAGICFRIHRDSDHGQGPKVQWQLPASTAVIPWYWSLISCFKMMGMCSRCLPNNGELIRWQGMEACGWCGHWRMWAWQIQMELLGYKMHNICYGSYFIQIPVLSPQGEENVLSYV